jgi:hypothetical protein
MSLDTVAEPFSEPTGGQLSARSEDSEVKRRRMGELETIPEGRDPAARGSSDPLPPRREAETNEANERGRREGMVQQRVQEIEEIERRRRRSRSPLPEVLRRQMAAPRDDIDPHEASFVTFRPFDGFVDEMEGLKGDYKASCVFYNSKSGDPEQLEKSNLFLLGMPENAKEGEEVWAGEPARNGEITWSQMTPEEKVQFQQADLKEWESLEKEFKAVKIWRGKEAQELRERYPDRILSSRMVRRKKPMPGLHEYKAKSRFCVHGHKDPDSGTFKTFAPTPSAEALNLVAQVISNEDLLLLFADVKAAFAQADKLRRPRGRLFVAPCEGVPIEEQDLIELIAPVYGLDDAPLRWFETVTTFLKKIGLRRSLPDPCIHVKHDSKGKIEALVLIEVDDFLIATRNEDVQKEIKEKLQRRFLFGKCERDEADFIGRKCKKTHAEVRMDQEKYILEKLEAIPLSKGRRSNKDEPLTEEEFKLFRSMLYRVSWVAHQTRPEASGTVSILSSRLHSARIRDVVDLNKMIGHLRSTSSQGLRFKQFKPEEMTFIGVSDAGGVDGEIRVRDDRGLPEDPVQGAWMVLASSLLPAHDQRIPISVLSWRSSKLKRRVTSTMASETISLSQCLGEVEWLQVFYRDLVFDDVKVFDWRRSIAPFVVMLPEECELTCRQQQCQITDAKSLYDALYKQCPSSRQDRRTALELAVIIDLMIKTGSQIRWTPHPRMPVDVMTKADITKGNGALLHMLKHGHLRIDKEENELIRRRSDPAARSRTRQSSEKLLQNEEEQEMEYFSEVLGRLVWSTENCGSCGIEAPLSHNG